jgi:hypothetical protein
MLLWIRLPDDHGKRGWMAILWKRMGRSRCMDLAEGDQNLSRLQPAFKKVIPRRQSYICRLVKGASAEVDMVRLEPMRYSIWHGHRSTILVLSCAGIRLVTRGLSHKSCFFTMNSRVRTRVKARSYQKRFID